MLEIQQLRNDLNIVTEALAKRGYTFPVSAFNALEAERKTIQTKTQDLQAQRNAASKKIGHAKSKGEDVTAIMAEVTQFGDELKQAEIQLEQVQQQLQKIYHMPAYLKARTKPLMCKFATGAHREPLLLLSKIMLLLAKHWGYLILKLRQNLAAHALAS
jgi:seryl-tRNA synthetase